MKRLISLVLVAALSFFSFMVYAEGSSSTASYDPVTRSWIVAASYVPSDVVKNQHYPLDMMMADMSAASPVSGEPYNFFVAGDLGWRREYSYDVYAGSPANYLYREYFYVNAPSFKVFSSSSDSPSFSLACAPSGIGNLYLNNPSTASVSHIDVSFNLTEAAFLSDVWYSFYFSCDHIDISNFSLVSVWSGVTVELSDVTYNVNSVYDNVYGRFRISASDVTVASSGIKLSFDTSFSNSVRNFYGFSVWQTGDSDDDIIAAINNQTNLINQQYQDTENKFQGAVNSGQAGANQEIQDNVGQLENFDNKIFTDVSDYTAQLDFGLGDWAEAAAGISYIGSIFMLIWDNSPTQVIVLSLMVGLCLLILGRGPRVAGEVRRHEERASRRKKGG